MTVLVTGSAGHLGEALMRTLHARRQAALGVDIKPSPFTDRVGSITDRAFVRRSLARVQAVIHSATLHKPHLATHSAQAFVDTNVTGTLILLEEAASRGVASFVFTSTTSAFGAALTPARNAPAVWVTEDLTPIARNIYGVSKLAAENLCELFARRERLPIIVLRTSRFFPEADDDGEIRGRYETANVQANELLYRRADLEDVVGAHLLALEKAPALGFGRYIITASTPFALSDLTALSRDAPSVVRRLFPDYAELYAARGWTMCQTIGRVYVNRLAMAALGWSPKYDFAYVLASLRAGRDFRSPLARAVGSKGYHEASFESGPYPVEP
jgi:nucleoside-diphosphate-sugar epimerase